jgi:hypothetical protein
VLGGLLRPGGSLSLAEVVPAESQRLSELLGGAAAEEAAILAKAEGAVYDAPDDARVGWKAADLGTWAAEAGLEVVSCEGVDVVQERRVAEADIDRWLGPDAPYGRALAGVGKSGAAARRALLAEVAGKTVRWRRHIALLLARAPRGK